MSRYAHIISSLRADYGGKGPLLDEAADAIEEAEERAEKYRNTLAEYLESHSKQAELIVRLEAELAAVVERAQKREHSLSSSVATLGNENARLRAELAAVLADFGEVCKALGDVDAESAVDRVRTLRADLAATLNELDAIYATLGTADAECALSAAEDIEGLLKERDALRAALVKAGEALEFYANKQVYEPDSVGRLPDLTFRAVAALTEIRKLTGENDDD